MCINEFTEFQNVMAVAGIAYAIYFMICAKFSIKAVKSTNLGLFAQSLRYE
jgi:hypothetical protein